VFKKKPHGGGTSRDIRGIILLKKGRPSPRRRGEMGKTLWKEKNRGSAREEKFDSRGGPRGKKKIDE